MSETVFEQIKTDINNNDIVLYMKGNKNMPACGFSGTVIHILKTLEVEFKDIDILENPLMRQGIKEFTNWPTIPQLYIKGEFIGGCDIIREMYQGGELQTLLTSKNIAFKS